MPSLDCALPEARVNSNTITSLASHVVAFARLNVTVYRQPGHDGTGSGQMFHQGAETLIALVVAVMAAS